MNPDSKTTKVIQAVKGGDKAQPGRLAADLEAARVRYESVRQDVISRGSDRLQALANLQAEIAKEQTEVGKVVNDAREG